MAVQWLCNGCAMAQTISRRSLIAAAWIRTPSTPCGFCEGQVATGRTAVSHVTIFQPMLHTPVHLQIFSQREKRVKCGDLRTKKKALSEIGECQKRKKKKRTFAFTS
jgi:hypothetical protein